MTREFKNRNKKLETIEKVKMLLGIIKPLFYSTSCPITEKHFDIDFS
jgi:hypothetical protein